MRVSRLIVPVVFALAVFGCSRGEQKPVADGGQRKDNKDEPKDKRDVADEIAKMPQRDPGLETKLAAERENRVQQLAAQERESIPVLVKAHRPTGAEGVISCLGSEYSSSVAFSPDGKFVATITGLKDLEVQVWDLMTGKIWKKISVKPPSKYVSALHFGQDRRTLVGVTDPGPLKRSTIILWDIEDQKEIRSLEHDSFLGRVDISPDGKSLVVANGSLALDDHPVQVLNLPTLEVKYSLPAVRYLGALAFSPCGKFLAVGGRNEVVLREANSGKKLIETSVRGQVDNLAFSPDGWTLMISDHDTHAEGNRLTAWDLESGKEKKLLDLDTMPTLRFSPDGKLLAVLQGLGKPSGLRDSKSGAMVQELGVSSGAFSPGGQLFVRPSYGLHLHPVKEYKGPG